MTAPLRDRTRAILRAELADAVLAVFLERGYSEVTVEEAARQAGVSRATFFRYFRSKEDVVVAAVEGDRVDYAAPVLALPADSPLTGWGLIRAAVEPVIDVATRAPDAYRARLRLIGSEFALKARLRERRAEGAESLAAALVTRGTEPLTARVLAAAGLAAVDVAWEEWAASEDADFRETVDAAFARLDRSGRPPQARTG
ncbi:TetR family transcriptional regulator [Rathayibacter tanaceti]|uniref:Fatty acid metabolism regulator protein n=2 Tax=Rathayibacter tanaceti TaxID=1671680 RepID=A0A162J0U9_9MICO|nr:TetR family transcriptional regulator [Rathayibacter tanaceti]KZX20567.1 Fatty acid metabolism regulator protein [Rathayibacter tanaceti]QHC54537.1 TetR family transcriptional regulator [Rathayibacter tanaceti]TCO33909.1 TetR family transcriptional regulator [Rathayibacter tanaceti]